ncbi:MAG: type I-U CRISPR-associated protein Cas5/Cas6 [Myxococcales bacterium]|nr:type I-U CRISPR-associated protein Cas5/Cas6 [Myxococcales bacterium]
MLALRIEYLSGRSVSTEYNARDRAEWPPHPARVFSALVAAWASAEERSDTERRALEWLETAGPPALCASDVTARAVLMHYVPDNPASVFSSRVRRAFEDATRELESARGEGATGSGAGMVAKRVGAAEKKLKKAKQALEADLCLVEEPNAEELGRARAISPPTRSRQGRFFPSVTPEDAVVHLVWGAQPPVEHREALATLSRRIVRVGHSASLVRCSVHDEAPEPNWFPDDQRGETILRVAGPGQLASLDAEFLRHRETEPRILPCRFQLYRRGRRLSERTLHESVFGEDWVTLRRIAGPRLAATNATRVALALRGALMSHSEQPPREALSGHADDGGPAQGPHIAFVPLPFVGHEHADGTILGIAIVFPRDTPEADRHAVSRALARWENDHLREDEESPVVPLRLGSAGRVDLERIAWGAPRQATLRPSVWCRPSREWLSVTPVALDRNPGDLYSSDSAKASEAHREAMETIAVACTNIGLPRPARVEVLPSATLSGTTKARRFPPFPPDPKKTRRVQVHAFLRFDEPVRGPILLGAGRFSGLGLFRPLDEHEVSRADRT